jgi:hypothetical protein
VSVGCVPAGNNIAAPTQTESFAFFSATSRPRLCTDPGTEGAFWGSFPKSGAILDVGTVKPVGSSTLKTQSDGKSGSGSGSDDSSSSHESEAENESESEGCYKSGRADLPYDARPGVGESFALVDAFLEKGAAPMAALDVTIDGGTWRLAELKSGARFTVSQADCDHAGNRDVGRDRIFVTWQNADGSVETDHLDMRYCKGGGGGGTSSSSSSSSATGACAGDDATLCGVDSVTKSTCDGGSLHPEAGESETVTSANCQVGLSCFVSTCVAAPN